MKEIRFLFALWKANLLSAMEYRIAFISQVIGMMLNNGVYFIFWVIFFDRFETIRGWCLSDMFFLFGVVACSFGIGAYLFGNVISLAEIITDGRLDYYLSLPRPVLLHALASKSVASGMGDFVYGLFSFILAGNITILTTIRFTIAVFFSICVLIAFLVAVQSLSFWMGNTVMLSNQARNALITFSLYPITLFDGTAKFFLFTVIPAAFIGAVPAAYVRSFSWRDLGALASGAFFFLVIALWLFHKGLRRYESGSAFQIQV